MDISEFATDEVLEKEGKWVDLSDETKLKIARFGNVRCQQAWRSIPRGVRARIENGTISEKKDRDLFADLLAKTIILDWEGMTEKGSSIEYTVETAKRFLVEYKDFRALVWELANDFQIFKQQEIEEDSKNLKGSSVGPFDSTKTQKRPRVVEQN